METQSVEYPQCTLADSFLRSGAARLVAYPFRMRQSDGHSSRSRPNWRKINQRPLQWEVSSKKKKYKENRKVNLSFPNRIDIHRMLGPRPAPNSISPLLCRSFWNWFQLIYRLSSRPETSSYHSAQSTLSYKQLCVNIQRQQVTWWNFSKLIQLRTLFTAELGLTLKLNLKFNWTNR